MTRDHMYALVTGLLSSDGSALPSDIDGERLALLEMAMEMTVWFSEPALLTYPIESWTNGSLANRRFVRSSTVSPNSERDNYSVEVIVAPRLPQDGSEELDIDHGLCFAVARHMASLCCKLDSYNLHIQSAKEICREYTSQTITGVPFEMRVE